MQHRILFRIISNVVTHYVHFFLFLGKVCAFLVGWILTLSIPILLLLGYYAPYFGERDALVKKLYSAGNPADVEISDQESVYNGFIALGSTRYLPFGIPVRITYSPGGNDSGMYRLLLNEVVIDGECVSACAWLFIMNPRACYTDNMVLRFHSWHRTFIRYKSLYTSVSSDQDFGIGWTSVVLLSDRTENMSLWSGSHFVRTLLTYHKPVTSSLHQTVWFVRPTQSENAKPPMSNRRFLI